MIPRYGEWAQRFGPAGLSVIGVHTPELETERDERRLRAFVSTHQIGWPVVLDPDYQAWERYHVAAWPTVVLIDRSGIVRAVVIGDSRSAEIEAVIRDLLARTP